MGKRLKVKKNKPIEEGIYKAKLKSVEEKEGQWGKYYRFIFMITNGEFKGKVVNGNTQGEIEAGNKTHKWVNALLGHTLDVDDSIDLDELGEKTCKIAIEHNVTSEGTFAKVSQVYKSKKSDDDDEEEEEEEPKKKKKDDDDDDEPKKKKKDDDDDDDEPKKKKKDDDDDDDEPKKKKKDDDEEEPKKKKKKDDDDDDDDDDDKEFD